MQRLMSNEPDVLSGQANGKIPNAVLTIEGSSSSTTNDSRDAVPTYTLYRRRFYGLAQLVLLNIIVSWDWLTFAAVSRTASEYFNVTQSSINWLSTGFLFAFVVISPFVVWTLNKGGPKQSILTASGLILVGNWVRYAGSRCSPPRFGVVVFGQILIGLSQPFVLAAPTRYSNLWFSDTGRVSATAVASLANPFGKWNMHRTTAHTDRAARWRTRAADRSIMGYKRQVCSQHGSLHGVDLYYRDAAGSVHSQSAALASFCYRRK